MNDAGQTPARRERWEGSLILPGYTDLASSLVGELAGFLGISEDEAVERCRAGAGKLAGEWRAAAPGSRREISEFYERTDEYLYDLTWWHSLAEDDESAAEAGIEALECALDHRTKNVLDFGSGIGSLGLLMAKHGMDVSLVEINPTLNAYARHRFERRGLRARFLDPDSLPKSAFDFVSAVDVMEHLPEPGEVLKRLAESLKPGGTLFVHLPPDEDASRPMHLWHGTKSLMQHVGDAGLWLEESDESSLILRRGDAPKYSLKRGIEVKGTKNGAVLLSRRPLMATRLNDGAANLLERLGDGKTASELSSASGLSLADTTRFLDGLAAKRILSREREIVPAKWPSVTVIVPAKDRPEQTRSCVESILKVDYPPEKLEVIVVDDDSETPLSAAIPDLPVKVVRTERNVGQAAARNLAAREAESEILAFTDNDCEVERGWLKNLVKHLCEPGVTVVGGRVLSPAPDGDVAAFEAVRSSLDMGEMESAVGIGESVAYLPTCNLAADRETYLKLGGMIEAMSLGEDADFVWRAIASGGRIHYEPKAGIVHHHRTKLPELLGRRADYASSEADLQHRHPKSRRQLVIPVFGITLLVATTALIAFLPLGLALFFVAAVMLAAEFVSKKQRLGSAGVGFSAKDVALAISRQHGASLYHLGANVCRYYSLPLLAASVFFWPMLPVLIAVMAIPAVVDHRRLEPEVSLPTFVLLYWLELSAYQIGVWRGCVERRTIRPLMARIRFSR